MQASEFRPACLAVGWIRAQQAVLKRAFAGIFARVSPSKSTFQTRSGASPSGPELLVENQLRWLVVIMGLGVGPLVIADGGEVIV